AGDGLHEVDLGVVEFPWGVEAPEQGTRRASVERDGEGRPRRARALLRGVSSGIPLRPLRRGAYQDRRAGSGSLGDGDRALQGPPAPGAHARLRGIAVRADDL